MPIKVNETSLEFHLFNEEVSYIFRVMEKIQQLEHLYYGKRVHHRDSFHHLIEREVRPSCNQFEGDHTSSLEHIKQEYPTYGTTDFRQPAFQILQENGSHVSHFIYEGYRTFAGKKPLQDLPATYIEGDDEAETIEIYLYDELIDCRLTLSYTIYSKRNVITRNALFTNEGDQTYFLDQVMSMSVDFPDDDYEMVHLQGAWAREGHVETKRLSKGIQSIYSSRGASSHVFNPFFALKRPYTTEHHGEVYGFSLVYSGNFLAQVEVDTYNVSRVTMGIHPFSFRWKLTPNKSFQTPECVLVFSEYGLNGMSQTYHNLYRERLVRGYWRDRTRPILLNNWEATYFDFNEEKLLTIAGTAKELGIELFVLDDGWFGKRDDDTSSLGDWFEDQRKLPNGVDYIADKVEKLGLKFGLWFEPEMICKDTQLYKKHPEWIIASPNRNASHGRNQFVLDFSRQEVVDYLFDQMDKIISKSNISYIKWDMNRHMTEVYSTALPADQQGEVFHRYILGVYQLYERLIQKFPRILFESCAGGGARFDPGMLYYAPQTWTSDDTDAVERLKIQYGMSLAYPLSSIGSHVSAVPNHQVGRNTPLSTRAAVAYFGTFGYELDVTTLTDDEKAEVKQQVEFFKAYRSLIRKGVFYRLLSPFEQNETSWMTVSEDKQTALVGYYKVLAKPNESYQRLRLKGLDPDKKYVINGEKTYFGDELMNIGIMLSGNYIDRANEYWSQEKPGDYQSRLFTLEAIE